MLETPSVASSHLALLHSFLCSPNKGGTTGGGFLLVFYSNYLWIPGFPVVVVAVAVAVAVAVVVVVFVVVVAESIVIYLKSLGKVTIFRLGPDRQCSTPKSTNVSNMASEMRL